MPELEFHEGDIVKLADEYYSDGYSITEITDGDCWWEEGLLLRILKEDKDDPERPYLVTNAYGEEDDMWVEARMVEKGDLPKEHSVLTF